MIILLISGKGRGHTLEHVRRWPVSFCNLWIQKQACFDLGRNSSLKIFCMASITLNHWLPQKSSSGRVLELSVLEYLIYLSYTAQLHKGHVKFISKARFACFGFIHCPNSGITGDDATELTHATAEFFSKSITIIWSLHQFYLLELSNCLASTTTFWWWFNGCKEQWVWWQVCSCIFLNIHEHLLRCFTILKLAW